MIALSVPQLWRYRSSFAQTRIETGYFNETFIADAVGTVLQRVPSDMNGYAISQVALADALPQPKGKQPVLGVSPFAYHSTRLPIACRRLSTRKRRASSLVNKDKHKLKPPLNP